RSGSSKRKSPRYVAAHTPQGVNGSAGLFERQRSTGKTLLIGNSTTMALMFLPLNASTPVNLDGSPEAVARLNPTRSKKNGSSRGPANTVIAPAVVMTAGLGGGAAVP